MSTIQRKDLKSPIAHHFVEMSHSVLDLDFVVIKIGDRFVEEDI